MTSWYDFDPLDAIRQLVALVDRHGLPAERVGSAALTHIATLAQASGQTVYRRTFDRDELRRQRLAR